MPLQKALRRASRRAFFWPEEAAQLIKEDRSLTGFSGVGPYLEKLIRGWIKNPPEASRTFRDPRRFFYTVRSPRRSGNQSRVGELFEGRSPNAHAVE
jgi:hypothetical protein